MPIDILHMANTVLFHGQFTFSSEEGPHQGDPVGTLLFCNTIQPLLTSLDSDLHLGYLDDVSLGSPPGAVVAYVAQTAKVGGDST